MPDQIANSEPIQKKPPMAARKSKRRYARELQQRTHQEMCGQFEVRGVDSDIDIAESFETQRPSVMSVLVYELYRRLRRVERRLVANERVVSIEQRKGVAA